RGARGLFALGLLSAVVGVAWDGFTRANGPKQRFQRALFALANDDLERAQAELFHLKDLPDYQPHAALISGVLLLQERKLAAALEEFQSAVEHDDTRALAWTLAGRALLEQRRFQAAEHAFLTALSYEPGFAEAHRGLAGAYFKVGDMPKAMGYLQGAAAASPHDPRPARFMATIARSAGQIQEATEFLQETLRRDDEGWMRLHWEARQEVLLELGQLQSELLHHAEALETLRELAETPAVLSLRAECHYAVGEVEAAQGCLTRALELDPQHSKSWLLQGRLALDANDLERALESLNRALERRPLDVAVHHALAQTYFRVGRESVGRQHAQRAQELRNLSEEFETMNQQVMHQPQDAALCFKLGLMAEQLGRESMAEYWYRAVLLLDPQHEEAAVCLARLAGPPPP
ncbi:MAG TPA: tetratricopeptide repeat protein, partial [Pirellulales bacterium]|nr:tetratricopeptide repeat protein [Pirellulales bacterium]